MEDLISELVVVGLRADARFDPTFGDGGQARSTYLYRRMRPRVVDYLRKEQEVRGDKPELGAKRRIEERNSRESVGSTS